AERLRTNHMTTMELPAAHHARPGNSAPSCRIERTMNATRPAMSGRPTTMPATTLGSLDFVMVSLPACLRARREVSAPLYSETAMPTTAATATPIAAHCTQAGQAPHRDGGSNATIVGPTSHTATVMTAASRENGPSMAGSATAMQRSLLLPVPRG